MLFCYVRAVTTTEQHDTLGLFEVLCVADTRLHVESLLLEKNILSWWFIKDGHEI